MRAPAGSKVDPFREWVCEQLRADPRIPSQRLREMACELGYEGGKTVFDDARLAEAKRQGNLEAELKRLSFVPLLVVDEVGYIPFDPEAAGLMFRLGRYLPEGHAAFAALLAVGSAICWEACRHARRAACMAVWASWFVFPDPTALQAWSAACFAIGSLMLAVAARQAA